MKKKKIIYLTLFFLVCVVSFTLIYINKLNEQNTEDVTFENTDRIPVLTFHRLVPDNVKKEAFSHNQWVGSVAVFEKMMKYLYDNNYETISTEEFYEWYIGKKEYSKKTVLITFDDGFYEDYYLAHPILKKYNLKATSFIVGSRIKEKTDKYNEYKTSYIGLDIIEKVRNEYPNHEFQSHTYNMHYYTNGKKHRIRTMTHEELVEDTLLNNKYGFTTLAYPYGDRTDDYKQILKDNGYLVAFRFGPSDYAYRTSERFAIPRIKINGYATLDDMIKWLNY